MILGFVFNLCYICSSTQPLHLSYKQTLMCKTCSVHSRLSPPVLISLIFLALFGLDYLQPEFSLVQVRVSWKISMSGTNWRNSGQILSVFKSNLQRLLRPLCFPNLISNIDVQLHRADRARHEVRHGKRLKNPNRQKKRNL